MATPRLKIRRLGPQDLKDFAKFAAFATVRGTSGEPSARFLPKALAINGWSVRGESCLIFGLFVDQSLVGTIALDTPRESRTNFGFKLLPEYWNMGFATEASIAILDTVIRQQGDFHFPLHAETDKTNLGALRVLQKIGFLQSAEQPNPDRIYFSYP